MSTQKQRHIRVDQELYRQLKKIKRDVGIPMTESIRRGMWFYCLEQGWVDENEVPQEIIASIKNVMG